MVLSALVNLLQIGLIIGTYGDNIYSTSFNPQDSTFSAPTSFSGANCSYICSSPEGYYAVSESERSGVYSFTKSLEQSSFTYDVGEGPCYIRVFGGTPYVLTANYGDGSVTVLRGENGKVAGKVQEFRFDGSGPRQERARQLHSRIHQVERIGKRLLVASDMGSDKIRMLKYTANPRKPFKRVEKMDVTLPAGSGPRHIAFNRKEKVLYCLTEISGELYSYDLKNKKLKLAKKIKVDPTGSEASGDVRIHPSGKWLYTSHRNGYDGICRFSLDKDGMPLLIDFTPTGAHPRQFCFSPDGRFLFVACRDSGCVQAFAISEEDGKLSGPVAELEITQKMGLPVMVMVK